MTVKTLFTKRVRRYLGAAIAAAVTTFVGLQAQSKAEAQTCTLNDATRWQLAITDTDVELTPEFIRFATESFLKACPDRPEYEAASRVAGKREHANFARRGKLARTRVWSAIVLVPPGVRFEWLRLVASPSQHRLARRV